MKNHTLSRPYRHRLKRFAMGTTALMMTAMIVTCGSGAQKAQAGTAKENTRDRIVRPMISAYVYDKANMKLEDRDAPYLSQMNYSFALIENGKLSGKHWKSIGKFQSYMRKHPHILPVLAVGGWGAEGFSEAASTDEKRKVFAQSAVEMMGKYGFLGLDIDWEYPGSSVAGIKSNKSDKENFTLLLKELRYTFDAVEKQDGKHRYLTIAVGGSALHAQNIEIKQVNQIVDQVNIMTYDLRGFEKTTGHHTNLYAQKGDADAMSAAGGVADYASLGIDKSKIMIGAAFYGRAWRNVKGGGTGLAQKAGTSGNKSYTYTQLKAMIDKGTYTLHWDDTAKAHYLFDGSTFISFESKQSIALKGEYAMAQGLQGVMFWEYNQDTTGELIKALYESMH